MSEPITRYRNGEWVRYSDHGAARESDKTEIERLRMENEALKGQLHEEIAVNLAFREKGGALADEDMPTFCGRLLASIAELEEDNASLFDENRSLAHLPSRVAELEAGQDEAVRKDAELVASIMRDVCECEPDDANHPETICILRGTLMLILDRNLGIDRAAIAAAKEETK